MSLIIGKIGENIAIDYLTNNKFVIITTNYRYKKSEIDIIALENNILCFIEVKNYKSNSLKPIYEAINKKKQKNLISGATAFINKNSSYSTLISRFDALFISHNEIGKIDKIELARNYFQP